MGIFGDIGGAIGVLSPAGLIGGAAGYLGGNALDDAMNASPGDYREQNLTSQENQNIENLKSDASLSAHDIKEREMQGVDGSKALKTGERQAQDASAMGMNPDLGKAISARQGQLYDQNMAGLSQRVGLNAEAKRSARLFTAYQASAAKAQIDMENQAARAGIQMDRIQIRNDVIGSLLGGIGGAAGSFAGASKRGGAPGGGGAAGGGGGAGLGVNDGSMGKIGSGLNANDYR